MQEHCPQNRNVISLFEEAPQKRRSEREATNEAQSLAISERRENVSYLCDEELSHLIAASRDDARFYRALSFVIAAPRRLKASRDDLERLRVLTDSKDDELTLQEMIAFVDRLGERSTFCPQ